MVGFLEPEKKKNDLSSYLVKVDQKKRSLEMYVARLAACDNIPFIKFRTSEVLRDLLRLRFNDATLPTSATAFHQQVMCCAAKVQDELKTVRIFFWFGSNDSSIMVDT